MLLIEPPDRDDLVTILKGLLAGGHQRDAVKTWAVAVRSQCDWSLGLTPADGYWYFYSLGHIDAFDAKGDFLLRDEDLGEYLADLRRETLAPQGSLTPLRGHQVDPDALRWPLTVIGYGPVRAPLAALGGGVRGVFEQRDEVVEHWHLAFENQRYLLVRHPLERSDDLFVLGSARDPATLERFLHALVCL